MQETSAEFTIFGGLSREKGVYKIVCRTSEENRALTGS